MPSGFAKDTLHECPSSSHVRDFGGSKYYLKILLRNFFPISASSFLINKIIGKNQETTSHWSRRSWGLKGSWAGERRSGLQSGQPECSWSRLRRNKKGGRAGREAALGSSASSLGGTGRMASALEVAAG